MQCKQFILLVLSLASTSAVAGGSVGNGGDVVYCDSAPATSKAELLDRYEARELREMDLDLGPSTLAPFDKALLAVQRLKALSPSRAATYESWIRSFLSETRFLDDSSLVQIHDVDNIITPNGCSIRQIAIQKEPMVPEDKRYFIDTGLWNMLNSDNQASLILHEVIYRETKLTQNTSVTARYFNALLSTHELDTMSLPDFAARLETLAFPWVEVAGNFLQTTNGDSSVQFYPSGVLQQGIIVGGNMQYTWAGKTANLHQGKIELYPDGSPKTLPGTVTVSLSGSQALVSDPSFYENGNISSTHVSDQSSLHLQQSAYDFIAQQNSIVSFYDSGTLQSCSDCRGSGKVQGQSALIESGYSGIQLYPDTTLKSAQLSADLTVKIQGTPHTAQHGFRIDLYPSGNIASVGQLLGPDYFLLQGATVTLQSCIGNPNDIEFYDDGTIKAAYVNSSAPQLLWFDGQTRDTKGNVIFDAAGRVLSESY